VTALIGRCVLFLKLLGELLDRTTYICVPAVLHCTGCPCPALTHGREL